MATNRCLRQLWVGHKPMLAPVGEIFWQQYAPESELGQHLSAEDYFALPYFMNGTDRRKYEETHELYLDEFSLLKGILVGYEDEPPTVN